MTTLIPASYTALLARMQTVAPDDLHVKDGVPAETLTAPAYLFVGVDDFLNTDAQTAVSNASQDWLDLGAFTKVETFSIWMTLVLSSGGKDFATLMGMGVTYMGLVEAALLPSHSVDPDASDGQLGTNSSPGPLGPTGWCNCYTTGFQRFNNSKGVGLISPIVVNCRTQFTDI